jgi:hypothetical protein
MSLIVMFGTETWGAPFMVSKTVCLLFFFDTIESFFHCKTVFFLQQACRQALFIILYCEQHNYLFPLELDCLQIITKC